MKRILSIHPLAHQRERKKEKRKQTIRFNFISFFLPQDARRPPVHCSENLRFRRRCKPRTSASSPSNPVWFPSINASPSLCPPAGARHLARSPLPLSSSSPHAPSSLPPTLPHPFTFPALRTRALTRSLGAPAEWSCAIKSRSN